jgi:hypothetical protein
MNMPLSSSDRPFLDASHLEDLKQAASKNAGRGAAVVPGGDGAQALQGQRPAGGSLFGWNRHAVELGLHERRSGVACLGAQKACCGNTLWEERHPEVAGALWALAEAHCQQEPTFRTTLAYTRLTAAEALRRLRGQGFAEDALPSPSTMAEVPDRNGYRLRPVVKAKPPKKSRKPPPSSPASGTRTAKGAMAAPSNG